MLGGLTWTLRFFPFEKGRRRHNYTSGRPTIAMMRQSISLSADVLNKATHTTILAVYVCTVRTFNGFVVKASIMAILLAIAYSVEIGPR